MMEKKSQWLIASFLFSIVASITYAYFNYVYEGDFLIDKSQVETELVEETVTEESTIVEYPQGVVESE